MILHRYVSWRFLKTTATILAGFSAIVVLVDMIEQIRRFADAGVSLSGLLWLSALNSPRVIYEVIPLVVLLSGLALFAGLARSSEMAVIRAAGRSAGRVLIGPGIALLALGILAVAAGNPIVAATSLRYGTLESQLLGTGTHGTATGSGALWLREGDSDGQSVLHATGASPDGTRLYGVTILRSDAQGQLTERYDAVSATLVPGAWDLRGVKLWPLRAATPEASASQHDQLWLPSTLTRDRIRDSFGAPSAIPIWDLPDFIRTMKRAGLSAHRHQVWFQAELSSPLFLLAMLVLAAGFTLGHPRGGGVGLQALSAVVAGFGLYFLRNFAMVLGENGQIPAALAAWAPPIAALMLATGLLLAREDG